MKQTAFYFYELSEQAQEKALDNVFYLEHYLYCDQNILDIANKLYSSIYGGEIDSVDWSISSTYTLLNCMYTLQGSDKVYSMPEPILDTLQMVIDAYTDRRILENKMQQNDYMFTENGHVI